MERESQEGGVMEESSFEDSSYGSFDNDEDFSSGDIEGNETDDESIDNGIDTEDGEDNEPNGGVESITIDSLGDIMKIDMHNISGDEVERYDFRDLDVAYQFYHWYGRVVGFSIRKSSILRDCDGEIIQQTFLCAREGFREDRGLAPAKRKRQEKYKTRCGCPAKFRVHVDIVTRRWYVTIFEFNHNHIMLDGTMCGLLPKHRMMTRKDVEDIESHRNAGIRPYQMYSAMANISGGFHKVGFVKKDLYNQLRKQKKSISSDASGAVKYLCELRKQDKLSFVKHSVDQDNRLERLFWCDGESRLNYEIFGDVLAFDATYRKNKYNCPFVIFSGVNHHNQTIVFASGLVTRETEETYVWLLEQFLCAMKGKTPVSVITDGDVAMKNAIKTVFPKAHHRLCAWHLLRNASTNVGIPEIMWHLKRCMLGDIEVNRFEELWEEMVRKFRLEDNNWMKELYEKRKMWSAVHMRGFFFAGLRTTSRCEALHSHLKQFVHSKINLREFVQQFHRCLTYFRYREIEADFQSNYGDPVIQTSLRAIEKSAASVYTKELFGLFRSVLKKSLLLRVVESQEITSGCIYKVSKYCGNGEAWFVTHSEYPAENYKCSCLRYESIGLPCDHLLSLLVYLDIDVLPKCLVLDRWTRYAKESIAGCHPGGTLYWDSQVAARYASFVKLSKDVAEYVYNDMDEYNRIVGVLNGELSHLKARKGNIEAEPASQMDPYSQTLDEQINDPVCARTKGCGANPTPTPGNRRRGPTCGNCGIIGHNRRFCKNPTVMLRPSDNRTATFDNEGGRISSLHTQASVGETSAHAALD